MGLHFHMLHHRYSLLVMLSMQKLLLESLTRSFQHVGACSACGLNWISAISPRFSGTGCSGGAGALYSDGMCMENKYVYNHGWRGVDQ